MNLCHMFWISIQSNQSLAEFEDVGTLREFYVRVFGVDLS